MIQRICNLRKSNLCEERINEVQITEALLYLQNNMQLTKLYYLVSIISTGHYSFFLGFLEGDIS